MKTFFLLQISNARLLTLCSAKMLMSNFYLIEFAMVF